MNKYLIDQALDIEVNGDIQNIHIRGNDPYAPIVLFVHGGPGVCDRSWVMPIQAPLLADRFLMVCWDQRMAGKSYHRKNRDLPMTLDQAVADLHDVVLYLCERFHRKKIFLVGHSWGTILSTLYLQKHHNHIAAYVGMGQFINGAENETISYDFVMDYAREHGDEKAIKALEEIGAPVGGIYKDGMDGLMVQRNYMTKFGGGSYKEKENIYKSVLRPFLTSREYNVAKDLPKYYRGTFHCLEQLWPQVVALKFDETVKKIDVPVFLFQGDHDRNTPTELVEPWFEKLEAPYKEWVAFHESAHSPIKEEPDLFAARLIEKLGDVARSTTDA